MLILDLKTVPDPAAAKRLLALEPFSDAEAVLALTTLRAAHGQQPMVPAQLRRIAAASLLRVNDAGIELSEFDDSAGERSLLLELRAELAREPGAVWAWDSSGSYRSQILARALAHGLALPELLNERGPRSLAAHYGLSPSCSALAELAAVHGLPHQLGLRAREAEQAYAAGDRVRLRAGSGADALITWILSITLDLATGALSADAAEAERQRLRGWLRQGGRSYFQDFLRGWTT